MVKAKKPQNSGLGKAIIRKRFGGNRPVDGDTVLHTTEVNDGPSWTKLQSVTQEGDLEAFLHNAELAGTEFTAEKLNIHIVTNDNKGNPYLLTAEQEAKAIARHEELKSQLGVPRRPYWDRNTTAEELQKAERNTFVDWRRNLALLQEQNGLLLTPYERNLEVWRQLWRVIERSDLIVQIVDARTPLAFYSEDLVAYVREVDPRKKCLLLVNKADMLTVKQRKPWADYFDQRRIHYSFFSAALAKKANEEEALYALDNEVAIMEMKMKMNVSSQEPQSLLLSEDNYKDDRDLRTMSTDTTNTEIKTNSQVDTRVEILTSSDLLNLFTSACPPSTMIRKYTENSQQQSNKITVGLVGYPNVGKSSTINAMCGAKRVSVSATPGKTKHFQTIHLTPEITLCDCPGLVFPSFATTKAEMVCNGVLPIDQLRESSGPATLVAQRIPKEVLESIYGINIKLYDEHEEGRTIPTGEELCKAYALARSFMKAGQGNPDESRAARYILKDYVKGKLLFVHPPPIYKRDATHFNAQLHDKLLRLSKKKTTQDKSSEVPVQSKAQHPVSRAIDNVFFAAPSVGVRTMGKFATQEFTRTTMGMAVGMSHRGALDDSGKKHHKKGKKHVKVRTAVRDE